MALLFAAAYPERTRALVLYGGYANFHRWVLPPEAVERFAAEAERRWGTGATLAALRARAGRRPALRRLVGAVRAALLHADRGGGAGADERRDRRARRPAVDPGADAGAAPDAGRARRPGGRALPGAAHPRRGVPAARRPRPSALDRRRRRRGRRHRGVPDRHAAARRAAPRCWRRCSPGGRCRRAPPAGRPPTAAGPRRCTASPRPPSETAARFGGRPVRGDAEAGTLRFDGAARAVRCAVALRALAAARRLPLAQGVHVGELEAVDGRRAGRDGRPGWRSASPRRSPRRRAPTRCWPRRWPPSSAPGRASISPKPAPIAVEGVERPVALCSVVTEQHLEPARRPPPDEPDLGRLSAARARGAGAGRRGPEQPRHRRPPRPQRAHRQAPRREHPAEARPSVARRRGGDARAACRRAIDPRMRRSGHRGARRSGEADAWRSPECCRSGHLFGRPLWGEPA